MHRIPKETPGRVASLHSSFQQPHVRGEPGCFFASTGATSSRRSRLFEELHVRERIAVRVSAQRLGPNLRIHAAKPDPFGNAANRRMFMPNQSVEGFVPAVMSGVVLQIRVDRDQVSARPQAATRLAEYRAPEPQG